MNIWINGQIKLAEAAALHVQDEAVRYGAGLFETIRIYQGHPFLLSRHIMRMYKSAQVLGFKPAFAENQITAAARNLIEVNQVSEGILKLFCTSEKVWITTSDHIPYSDDLYQTGINAMISQVRRNETSPLVALKTFNYLENILIKRKAMSQGFREALFLNTKGNLAEGTTSNIFLVKNGVLITPSTTEGILPGITRELVLELAQENNTKTEERKVSLEELWTADEIFLTNSLMEIMPLIMIGTHMIGPGNPGSLTIYLRDHYRRKSARHLGLPGT